MQRKGYRQLTSPGGNVAVVFLSLVSVVCVGVGVMRWRRDQRWEAEERRRLRSTAHIWGLAMVPGESTTELRERVDQAMRLGRSADPLETAARALRAQRQRMTQQG
jgi:hypothetical protein